MKECAKSVSALSDKSDLEKVKSKLDDKYKPFADIF